MSIYIFAYGSLLNRTSAENALKRTLKPDEMQIVKLPGFTRVWRAKELLWFDSLAAQKTGIFLDIGPRAETYINGVMINLTDNELEQIKLREKNYACVDISSHFNLPASDCVYTFISRIQNQVKPGDSEVYIPDEYIKLVENGCRALGSDFYQEYLATTGHSTLPKMSGSYRFIDPVQARFI